MREAIEETEYRLVSPDLEGGVILEEKDSGNRSLWFSSDDFAGYVVEIDGVGYEFVRSIY